MLHASLASCGLAAPGTSGMALYTQYWPGSREGFVGEIPTLWYCTACPVQSVCIWRKRMSNGDGCRI